MTKTKITNGTDVVITLKEGTAGLLRKICDLQPGFHRNVTSEHNQTYKEYWCIGNGSDQFTLSSDDLLDWKEIVIKPTGDKAKFTWEGFPPKEQGTSTHNQGTTPHSSIWSKTFGRFFTSKPSGPASVIIITDPATAKTTIATTDPDSAQNTASSTAPPVGTTLTTTTVITTSATAAPPTLNT